MIQVIFGLLLAANLVAFVMMGIDKRRALLDQWRIPEKTLLLACAPFAALGGYIGMKVFHHKTRKPKFFVGVPAMLIVQVILLIALWRMF